MQWLYVYFPRLQLDQYEMLQQHATQSVVVIDSDTNTVIQCSEAALTAAIKPGMGLAEVSAMNNQTEVIVHSPASEESQLMHLAATLYNIASDIVLCQPSGIAINLTPLVRYYQGLDNFVALCQQTLRSCHVTYQFGTGATIEISRVLAHRAMNAVQERAAEINLLQQSPLTATQLTQRDIEQLHRVGVRTVGQLLQIPLDELGKRFKNNTIGYVLALRGVKQPPYTLFHPQPTFNHYMELPFAVELAPRLLRYLAVLLQRCCDFLHHRSLATDALSIELTEQDDTKHLTINAGAAHLHFDEWLSLIALKLERLSLDSAVSAIRLNCDQFTEFAPENFSLLDTSYSRHAENMLLGKLLARLGNKSIVQPRRVNDPRLEYAASSTPGLCNVPAMAQSNSKADTAHSAITMHQPALLLLSPQPLTEETHIVYGPERLHTGWWDAHSVKRDYFIAITPRGQRLCVFRNEQLHWYVQGYFA